MKFKQLFEKAIFVDKKLNEIKNIFRSFERKVKNNNIHQILKLINDKLEKFDIEIYVHYSSIPFPAKVFINGYLNVTTQEIKIILPKNYYELVSNDHIKLFKLIINTIEHELIHREQLDRQNIFPTGEDENITQKKYLSSQYEIMAHARSAISNLKINYSKNEILKAMRNFKGYRYRHSPLYDSEEVIKYFEHFYDDKGQKIWKKFIKYLYQYLQN